HGKVYILQRGQSSVGNVNRGLDLPRQRVIPRIARYPHHRERRGLVSRVSPQHELPQRIARPEVRPRQRLIDHRHVGRVAHILLIDVPPAQQRNAHRCKNPGPIPLRPVPRNLVGSADAGTRKSSPPASPPNSVCCETPTARTPGSAASLCCKSRYVPGSAAGAYPACRASSPNVTTWLGSNPSVWCSSVIKVRTSSPAPISSNSDSAVCAAARPLSARILRASAVAAPPRIESVRRSRVERSAGANPNAAPATTATASGSRKILQSSTAAAGAE